MDEKLIREELAKVLKEDPSNYNKVLELSRKLASFDEENIRFSVDAGIIDRLGTELVARQETAVSELVKNSYDADATEVTLTFKDTDKIGGTLTIEDDGTGMSRDELINGFMRISSTNKLHAPISERYHRNRAGQKGIGRFAVQRLGKKLTIFTQTLESEKALKLVIEWDKYRGDKDLIHIANKISLVSKRAEEGTTLIIEGLRDRWTRASIKRIYRYVSGIIQPFPLAKKNITEDDKKETVDPGFKSVLKKIETGGKVTTIADEANMIYDHAIAQIDGWIGEDGIGVYTVESKRLDINLIDNIGSDPDDNAIPFKYLKNVQFRAYYYIYRAGLISKMYETAIINLSRKIGGIRLYRNGFRVLPYGEQGDDWLLLDESVKRRTILPVHGNLNFFGFVELTDEEKVFNETSSREGLMENEALLELKNFIYRTILAGVVKVAEVRNVKIQSSQKKIGKKYEKIEVRIRNIAKSIEELEKELDDPNPKARKRRKKKTKEIKDELDEIAKAQREERKAFLQERSMLRVLSSVGLTIGQFIHEVRDYLLNMESDINYLKRELKSQPDLLKRLHLLDKNFTSFRTYTSYFDEVVSQNSMRKLKLIELQNTIEKFWESMVNDTQKAGITFKKPIREKYGLYTLPMHPSEWSSILFNFYTNSKKAIKRTKKLGEIFIECGFSNNNMLFLEFSDTGDGIPEENEEKIFDQFFTTSAPNSLENINDTSIITGTGLGLKIVKDIVSSYRGSVQVVSPKENFSTCIRVEIPRATEKQLEEKL